MISTKQYIDSYNRYTEHLRIEAERISKSTETRMYLIKNTDKDDWSVLLTEAVNCIADLTGDECFRKEVIEAIERRQHQE